MMTPLDYYNEQCQKGLILADTQQLSALHSLQRTYQALLTEHQRRSSWTAIFRPPKLVQGVYLWGSVGIGKTFLMDCFYHSLTVNKRRMHFYAFMQYVHETLAKYQGHTDPLYLIAAELSREVMVLCFDELLVTDITDAMLLGRLFKALFAQGVCLVTTSNTAPDDLYKNGLQRSQFLPAIALLKHNTEIVHLSSVTDYRLHHLKEAGVFYTPLDEAAHKNMQQSFVMLTEGEPIEIAPILIDGRLIEIKKRTAEVIWFDFSKLCQVPRSQKDYLAIAQQYRTVFISDVPVILEEAKDTIILFMGLVDVFYDAHVRLIISAAAPVEQLYPRGYRIEEYVRTYSRLREMQSRDYFLHE